VNAVYTTLYEAVALVVLVVLVFLQSWRTALIPIIAIPGVADRHLRGDERARLLAEQPHPVRASCSRSASWSTTPSWWSRTSSARSRTGSRPATPAHKTMDEVGGALVAIALVLAAVFVPDRLHPGHHGPVLPAVRAHHRGLDADLGVQLADLSPALAALLLSRMTRMDGRPATHSAGLAAGRQHLHRGFDATANGYAARSRFLLKGRF
jgi:HAE1 family hydrophobic/amphiphilic exporter-1